MRKKQNLKNKVIMLVTLRVKFRKKDCKTTELGLLLQIFPLRIVTFVETLGSHLKNIKEPGLLHTCSQSPLPLVSSNWRNVSLVLIFIDIHVMTV